MPANNFEQSDDFLADLRAMRQALEERKRALDASFLDPAEAALLQQEVSALRELIMAIGQSLWDEVRVDPPPGP